jgi:CheY-like chemotaxis protein
VQSASPNRRSRDLLIIDDDVAQAYLFERLLNELGLAHKCHHAADGRQALDFLRRCHPYENAPRPELIILDIHMPGIDGCAVLGEIKRDSNLRCIPVIMFSLAGAEEIDACYCEHANAYIRKPADYEGTLHVVRQIERFWFHTVQLPVSPTP